MPQVPARFVLWLMAFLSYMLQNILISNISIAMTDMVENPGNQSQVNDVSKYHSAETYAWDEAEAGVVIGAPYWLLPVGNVVSGLVALKVSPKVMIGFSILVSSLLNLLTPLSANISFTLLVLIRVILGFVIGLAFPSVLTIIPYWIPVNERGRFVSCIVGYNFGSAVVNFFGGLLIDMVNWKAVFYCPGIFGMVWCIAWKYLMYDRPEQHPRISDQERELLSSMNATLKEGSKRSRKPTPWKEILLSVDVWINIFAQFGCVWTWMAITSYGPLFLKTIHNMSITRVGFAIGTPFLLRAIACLLYSALTDHLIAKKLMSTTNVRKLSLVIANIIPAICLVIQIIFEENLYITLTSITIVVVCTGMNINGGIAGLMDISPNYGGAIQGIGGAVNLAGGFLIPILVGYLTLNNNTIGQWRKFFIITCGISFFSGVLFVLTWNSETKEWNDDRTGREIADEELKRLKGAKNGTSNKL